MAQTPRKRTYQAPYGSTLVDPAGVTSAPLMPSDLPEDAAAPVEPEGRHPWKAGLAGAESQIFTGIPQAAETLMGTMTPLKAAEYRRRQQEAQAEQDRLLPGGAKDIRSIRSFGDVGQFLNEQLGVSAPQMVSGMAAGALAGTVAEPGGGTILGGLAGIAGGALGGTPFFIGSNVARATEGGQKDLLQDQALKSVAFAPVQGALDYLGEKVLPGIGKVLPGPGIALKGGVLSRMAQGAVLGSVEEPLSEIPQQVFERAAAGLSLSNREAGQEYLSAGVNAAGLGGAMGGVGGVVATPKDKSQNRPEEGEPDPTLDKMTVTSGSKNLPAVITGGGLPAVIPGEPHPEPVDILAMPGQRALPAPSVDRYNQPSGDQPQQLSAPRSPSDAFREAIASNETGGRKGGGYQTRGPTVRKGQYKGQQAAGRYGIMPDNIGPWAQAAGLGDVSLEQFLASPEIQDTIFNHRFGVILREQGGNVEDAASVWFTGQPLAKARARGANDGNIDAPEYVRRFVAALKGGGGVGAQVAAGADPAGPAATSPEEMLRRIEEMSGTKTTGDDKKVATKLATAIANGDEQATDAVSTARQELEAMLSKLNDADQSPQALRARNKADRYDRIIAAAEAAAAEMADIRRKAGPQPDFAPPAGQAQAAQPEAVPQEVMANAGEQLVKDGALDRQVAAEQPQAQPLDEASAKLQAATRSQALSEIGKNQALPDKVAAFEQLRSAVPGIEPLTQTETNALKVAEHLQRFGALGEQVKAAAKEAAQPGAAAETTPTPEPIAPEPAAPANPREAQIRERATGRAAALGSSQKTGFWQGVDDYFGKKTKAEPPPPGSDRETWFNMGREFAAKQDEELGGTSTAAAEPAPTKAPKPQPVSEAAAEAAADRESAPKPKPDNVKAAPETVEQTRARVQQANAERKAKEDADKETARVEKAARRAVEAEADKTPPAKKTRARKKAPAKAEEIKETSKKRTASKKATATVTDITQNLAQREQAEDRTEADEARGAQAHDALKSIDTVMARLGKLKDKIAKARKRLDAKPAVTDAEIATQQNLATYDRIMNDVATKLSKGTSDGALQAKQVLDKYVKEEEKDLASGLDAMLKAPKLSVVPKAEPTPKEVAEEAERAAEKKRKDDVAAFEVKTERAADKGDISAFQRQNLDKVADTVSVEAAEALFDGEVARFKRINDAQLGKGDTISDMLARAKGGAEAADAAVAATPQSKANVVPPAKPVPGVTVGEAPPLTVTTDQLSKLLTLDEKRRLSRAYGHAWFKDETLAKFAEDFAKYVSGVREGIAKAVQIVAQRVQASALALMIVFNPAGLQTALHPTMPAAPVVERMVDIKTEVPASARAQMSPRAIAVYEAMAETAKKQGSGFFIADKPNGMLHAFDKKGGYITSSKSLYGAQAGDILTEARKNADPGALPQSQRVTPAGTYKVNWWPTPLYTGGGVLDLQDVKTGESLYGVAMHSVYLRHPEENRVARLESKTTADDKISSGCINTTEAFFTKYIVPHKEDFKNGLVFVLPDNVAATAALFPTTQKLVKEVPTRQDDAPVDQPTLPPDRTRIAIQAGRRRGGRRREGRGSPTPFDMAANRARIDREMAQRLGDKAPLPELQPGFSEPASKWPEEPGARVVATQRELSRMNRNGEQNTDEYMEVLRANDEAKAQVAQDLAKRGEPTIATRPRLSTAATDRLIGASEISTAAKLDRRLRAALDRRGLSDVMLETTDRVALGGDQGRFGITRDRLKRVIQVALDGENADLSLDHEMVHALEDMGVLRKNDFAKLLKAAMSSPEIREFLKPYSDRPRREQNGEAVAEFVARMINNPGSITMDAETRGIISRVKQAFAALAQFGRWALGQGSEYKTVDDIVRAIDSGEVGSKARTAAIGSSVPQRDNGPGFKSRRTDPGPYAKRTAVKKSATALHAVADNLGKSGHVYLTMTEDLANILRSMGVDAGRRVIEAHSAGHAEGRAFEERALKTKEKYERLSSKEKGVKPGSVNRLMQDSTESDEWAFEPTHLPASVRAKVVISKKLNDQFKVMSAEAQQVMREAFKLNYDINNAMKAEASTQINADYKAEMDAAEASGASQKAKDAIAARKDRAVRHLSRAFDTQEGLPYMPLKRSGSWVVVAKSPAFRAAEKANDKEAIQKMISDPKHHFVDFRDTVHEAEALASHVETAFPGGVDRFERSKVPEGAIHRDAIFLALDQLRTSAAGSTEKGSEVAKRLNRLITDMYLHTLSETSGRKAELGRNKVPATDPVTGEGINMMMAFVSRAKAQASLIASMHNGPVMHKALRDMHAQAADLRGAARTDAQRIVNEVMYRYTANAGVQPSRTVDKVVSTISAWTLLTSPFYYLQNASQAILITLPVLASQYGYPKAIGMMARGYKDFFAMTKGTSLFERVDFSKAPDDIKELVDFLAKRGRLDAGFAMDLGKWEINGDGLIPDAQRLATRFFRMFPQRVEVANRVATGSAAYRAALADGKSKTEAMEAASKLIYDTHGDYSGFNAPTPFHQLGNAGKVLLQFKKFQFIMGSLLGKEFHRAFFKKGVSPEERAEGMKALAFLSGHMLAVGGILGMPAASLLGPAVAAIMNLFDDDDDKDYSDWKEDLRAALGEGGEGGKQNWWSDFLFKGAPYALGADTSDRMGLGNVAALAPDISSATSKEEFYAELAKAALGPSGGLISKAIDGWGFGVTDHDWVRAVETIAPTGFANLMKAERIGREGLTDKKGDVLLKPEYLQGLPQVLTAIGVRPRELANQGDRRSLDYKTDAYYDSETATIKRHYTAAVKDRDAAGIAKARKEFVALQAAKKRDGVKPAPLGTLLQSPGKQLKRERNTIGGVEMTPANRQLLMDAMFADDIAEARQLMAAED
jgi:hypothetical protein